MESRPLALTACQGPRRDPLCPTLSPLPSHALCSEQCLSALRGQSWRVLRQQTKGKRSLLFPSVPLSCRISDFERRAKEQRLREGEAPRDPSCTHFADDNNSPSPVLLGFYSRSSRQAISVKTSFWGQLCVYYSPLAATETAAHEQ